MPRIRTGKTITLKLTPEQRARLNEHAKRRAQRVGLVDYPVCRVGDDALELGLTMLDREAVAQ